MEAFETTLTGSDGSIDGIVEQISNEAYQFSSLDGALQLTIIKSSDGNWTRLRRQRTLFVRLGRRTWRTYNIAEPSCLKQLLITGNFPADGTAKLERLLEGIKM